MRKLLVFFAGCLLGPLAFSGAALAKSSTSVNQRFTIIFNGGENAPGTIVASGVINGAGTEKTINDNFNPSGKSFTFTDLVTINGGTFRVSGTVQLKGNLEPDPKTCVTTNTATGTFTLSNGTGRFSRVSGSGTLRATNSQVSPKTGNHCSDQGGRVTTVVHAQGHVTLPQH